MISRAMTPAGMYQNSFTSDYSKPKEDIKKLCIGTSGKFSGRVIRVIRE